MVILLPEKVDHFLILEPCKIETGLLFLNQHFHDSIRNFQAKEMVWVS